MDLVNRPVSDIVSGNARTGKGGIEANSPQCKII